MCLHRTDAKPAAYRAGAAGHGRANTRRGRDARTRRRPGELRTYLRRLGPDLARTRRRPIGDLPTSTGTPPARERTTRHSRERTTPAEDTTHPTTGGAGTRGHGRASGLGETPSPRTTARTERPAAAGAHGPGKRTSPPARTHARTEAKRHGGGGNAMGHAWMGVKIGAGMQRHQRVGPCKCTRECTRRCTHTRPSDPRPADPAPPERAHRTGDGSRDGTGRRRDAGETAAAADAPRARDRDPTGDRAHGSRMAPTPRRGPGPGAGTDARNGGPRGTDRAEKPRRTTRDSKSHIRTKSTR